MAWIEPGVNRSANILKWDFVYFLDKWNACDTMYGQNPSQHLIILRKTEGFWLIELALANH
jgi:hypothetical protein